MQEDSENPREIKMYVDGTFKEYIQADTIIDFPLFISTYAKQEGIKNYHLRVNRDPVGRDQINKIHIEDVSSIEINTFDVART